tara:strand:- start:72140 stop:72430 length:291 start_codon:yes stop_codon:yes gene_type:complete
MGHNSFGIFVTVYFIVGTVANIGLFINQAIKLHKVKDATSLSFGTFLGFNLIQLSTILYGVLKQDNLLIYGYICTFIACGFITIMIPVYNKKNRTG